jgi:hypothetical protein
MDQPPLTSPPDRLIDAEKTQRLPDSWREEYMRRSLDKLPADVVHLYDLTWKQKREIDLKAKAILVLNAELEHSRRNLFANWILTVGQLLALVTALIKIFWLR